MEDEEAAEGVAAGEPLCTPNKRPILSATRSLKAVVPKLQIDGHQAAQVSMEKEQVEVVIAGESEPRAVGANTNCGGLERLRRKDRSIWRCPCAIGVCCGSA